jgi:hypothetical protein
MQNYSAVFVPVTSGAIHENLLEEEEEENKDNNFRYMPEILGENISRCYQH